jgi:multidrug efflux pump subunit AcrA (membrane-fusion protein)
MDFKADITMPINRTPRRFLVFLKRVAWIQRSGIQGSFDLPDSVALHPGYSVHEGQQAVIKIETFPFTKYGTIEGELIMVSNDATPDENLGLVYAIKVKMDRTIMRVEEKTVNLSPGMAVTVEVNMGKRRLIEYLTSPLLRYKDESARER